MFRFLATMACATTRSNVPLIYRMVDKTCDIVSTSQCIVRQVMQSGQLGVVDKGKDDFQTKADRAAQNFITKQLSDLFPKAAIIGEEGENVVEDFEQYLNNCSNTIQTRVPESILTGSVPIDLGAIKEEDVVIWIDPLDGTAEFTKGVTEGVTVLVGFAVAGKAIAGVIGQPFYLDVGSNQVTGRTLWGIPGVGFGGFDLGERPLAKRVVTTTRSHSNPKVEKALACLSPDEILRVGGAGYKTILLMEGRANAYVFASAGCKKWDSCAPEAVLKAVGGEMTDMGGKHYCYEKEVQFVNEGGILATAAGEDHQWYVDSLKKAEASP